MVEERVNGEEEVVVEEGTMLATGSGITITRTSLVCTTPTPASLLAVSGIRTTERMSRVETRVLDTLPLVKGRNVVEIILVIIEI